MAIIYILQNFLKEYLQQEMDIGTKRKEGAHV